MSRLNIFDQYRYDLLQYQTRRHFLRESMAGLAALWLSEQLAEAKVTQQERDPAHPLAPRQPHFPAKAKRVIYMHMAGSPSPLELFEYKPELNRFDGKDCPQEFLEGKRFAFIRGIPKLLGGVYPFHQEEKTGFWMTDRLPHFEKVMHKVCFIRSMQTEQFNHAPAQLLLHTGNQNFGYPAMGSWVTWGLGSENQNLPGFMVLLSGGRFPDFGKSGWSSGFLPSAYQGVQCRSSGDPVLFLSNPDGMSRDLRGRMVEAISNINRRTYSELGDPETVTRIAQYEMAYRMQVEATDAMNLSKETKETHEMYGTNPGHESFANNCLLARRLVERGVRYVQLFDWGWDSHGSNAFEALEDGFAKKCESIDKPLYALLTDLEQRGLLDETLVIWGGEFGRTPMQENRGGRQAPFKGRDHNPSAFTIWMAGGGVKPGFSYGETDPIGYETIKDTVNTRDFQATLMHLLGMDVNKLIYPFQGLDQKITGVKPFQVVKDILV